MANAAGRLAILNRDRLNEADLLRKLADLHRAGVLSDAEFEDKIALVGRLVAGETAPHRLIDLLGPLSASVRRRLRHPGCSGQRLRAARRVSREPTSPSFSAAARR